MNRKVILIVVVAGALLVGIFGALIGTRAGDTNCGCRKPSDAGWMGFSIVWFLGSLGAIVLALIWAFKPGYLPGEGFLGQAAAAIRQ